MLVDEIYVNFLNFHFISNNLKSENFTHSNILAENVDIIFSMHESVNNKLSADSNYNPITENLNIKSKFLEVRIEIENILRRVKNNIVYFLAVIGAVVTSLVILFISLKIGKLMLEYKLGRNSPNIYDSVENLRSKNESSKIKKAISLSSLTKKFIK